MLTNLKFIFIIKKNYYQNILLILKLKIYFLYYIKNFIFFKFLKISNNLLWNRKLLILIYSLFIKISNLDILTTILLDINKFKIANIFLPKKYNLTTVLRSPHVDKRSREQFHIINYKSSLKYPILFSILNNNFINTFFFFEKGFNIVLKNKIKIY